MLIGLGHVAQVGKDVSARALVRDLQFEQRAFADPMRELALKLDPLVTASIQSINIGTGAGRLEHVVGGMGWEGAKAAYPEVRRILQALGTGARELFGEDFWVDLALKDLPERCVISDVRFPNEAEAIHAAGGKLIKIDRPGRKPQGHISETALADFDDWDLVVTNDQGILELEQEIVMAVKGWLK